MAWPSLVATIKALHELPVDDCPFDCRLEGMLALATEIVADGAVESAFLGPEQRGRPYVDLLAEVEADRSLRLAQEATDLVVCHGDACLPNLLVDPETLGCTGIVDLGRLGLADRHVDLSLVLANACDGVFEEEADAGLGRGRDGGGVRRGPRRSGPPALLPAARPADLAHLDGRPAISLLRIRIHLSRSAI